MDIGTTLNLEFNNIETRKMEKHRCKVIGKNEEFIYIDYPIHMKTRKTAFLQEGLIFNVTFIGKDQNLYTFNSKVVGKGNLTVPALLIEHPIEGELKRIQRRQYVRIDTSVDIAVHCPKHSFPAFTTTTMDISGGGLTFVYPLGVKLIENNEVDITIVLLMNTGMFKYINVMSELLYLNTLENNLHTASVKFLTITKKERENVIQFGFEKQREARKKELT